MPASAASHTLRGCILIGCFGTVGAKINDTLSESWTMSMQTTTRPGNVFPLRHSRYMKASPRPCTIRTWKCLRALSHALVSEVPCSFPSSDQARPDVMLFAFLTSHPLWSNLHVPGNLSKLNILGSVLSVERIVIVVINIPCSDASMTQLLAPPQR